MCRLVRDCPLARMREDSAQTTNQHVLNLLSSIHQPLYMECKDTHTHTIIDIILLCYC